MPFKSARQRAGEAMAGAVAPITGGRQLVRPELKRAAKIIGAGLVLSFFASKMAPESRGAAPLLCLSLAVLVALVDFHRTDRRVFPMLVAVSALAMMVALAAASTEMTRGATDQATVLGNQASIAGPDKLGELAKSGWEKFIDQGLPWLSSKFAGIKLPWSP